MKKHKRKQPSPFRRLIAAISASLFLAGSAHAEFKRISTYNAGSFDASASEIISFDPTTNILYSVNAEAQSVDLIDISTPSTPTLLRQVSFSGTVNSVDVHNGLAAAAVQGATSRDAGTVVFFGTDGVTTFSVAAGVLPDSLAFSPDGSKVIVANEGEPYGEDESTAIIDPEGSITIVNVAGESATQLDFTSFNAQKAALISSGVKITRDSDGATVAQDLQPEYVTVTPDSSTAVITLQENNALAFVDLATNTITSIKALGSKDWSTNGTTNGFDASDQDAGINITNWPVKTLYQPDTIQSFTIGGNTYFITANEGDASEVEVSIAGEDTVTYTEEAKVSEIALDETAFPNAAALQTLEQLGRFKITTALGNTDADPAFEELYGYGGRSFTIWDASGDLVYDSGSHIEETIAALFPEHFNTDSDANAFDKRSTSKGPEPESVTVGTIGAQTFAFVGLERTGGVMIYDITNPAAPVFETYLSGRDFGGDPEASPSTGGDLAPESIVFVPATDSPTSQPLLMVAHEVSGTIAFYEITTATPVTVEILHASDLEGGSTDNLDSAKNFAAIIEGLKSAATTATHTPLILSAGDNFLPGPVFGAAGDRSMRDTFRDVLGNSSAREGAGRVDISIMNIIGFDASALGNHEFDAGTAALEEIIATDIRSDGADPRWLGADFPYLSSNLDFSGDDNIGGLFTEATELNTAFASPLGASAAETLAEANNPKIAKSTLIEKDGQTFGIIGGTTQRLSTISSPGGVAPLAGIGNDMAALAAVLQPEINQVIASGVNKIILVTHLQDFNLEKELIGLLSGVDVIIAGGSDTLLATAGDRLHAGDSASDDYPFVTTNKDNDTALLVSTDGQYSYVGRLVFTFDADGNITTVDDTLSRPFPTDSTGITEAGWASESAAFAANTSGELVQRLIEGTETTQGANDLLVGIADVVNVQDGNLLGKSDVFLEGRREFVRTEETNLGALTAIANMWVAQSHDSTVSISLKNGGGIRAQIGVVDGNTGDLLPTAANPNASPAKPAGSISQLDIANSLRFNNGLSLQTVTAQQLREILEHGVAVSGPGSTPGQFPQVAGLRFVYDVDRTPIEFTFDGENFVNGVATQGERIRFAAIVNEETGAVIDIIVSGGQVVGDPSRAIRMVTLDFLAGPSFAPTGGDGYPMAGYNKLDPTFANRVDLGDVLTAPGLATFADPGSEQDAFAEYMLSLFNVTAFNVNDTEVDRRLVSGEDLTDADNDGLNLSVETALNESDSTPNPFAAAALKSIVANSVQYGLYTETNIQDLRGTGVLIQAGAENITLQIPLEENSTLDPENWSPLSTPLEVTFPKAADKNFYRLTLPE